MHYKIPSSSRKKSLIIVDVQPGFLNKRNRYIVERICTLIKRVKYNLIVESVFHAEKGSLWDTQTDWTLPKDRGFYTDERIMAALAGKKVIHVEKETKSVFKGKGNVHKRFQKMDISEVHIVGLDADDCVLATAHESFDLGYHTYVIEECTDTSSGRKEIKKHAFGLLRNANLTNHSCIEPIRRLSI